MDAPGVEDGRYLLEEVGSLPRERNDSRQQGGYGDQTVADGRLHFIYGPHLTVDACSFFGSSLRSQAFSRIGLPVRHR